MTTRIHFAETAAIIRQHRELYEGQVATEDCLNSVTRDLADMFYRDNPRFDRARFYRAAGMEEYR